VHMFRVLCSQRIVEFSTFAVRENSGSLCRERRRMCSEAARASRLLSLAPLNSNFILSSSNCIVQQVAALAAFASKIPPSLPRPSPDVRVAIQLFGRCCAACSSSTGDQDSVWAAHHLHAPVIRATTSPAPTCSGTDGSRPVQAAPENSAL
jgi:hypothetical protein